VMGGWEQRGTALVVDHGDFYTCQVTIGNHARLLIITD
jgi:hypothetical protein